MRRVISLLIILSLLLSLLCSCRSELSAHQMLSEFIDVYGAEGIIYSPEISEGAPGYIPDGLMEKVYMISGNFPENFAVFLNSHPYGFSECGLFVCEDADTLLRMEETCLERIRLLSGAKDSAFVKVGKNTVFYSTMSNRERAEKIWREIMRKN